MIGLFMESQWKNLPPHILKNIVELAMQDRVSFDSITEKFGLNHGEIVKVMRKNLKPASFKRWRQRSKKPSLSKLKHKSKRSFFKDSICPTSFLKKNHGAS